MDASIVLVYGFDGPEVKKLRAACGKLGLRLRKVLPEEWDQPVGAFAGRGAFTDPAGAEQAVPGQMLVLCHVTERQLDALLSSLRTVRVGRDALKAVLTDTNARWSGRRLFDELTKEHAGFGKNEKEANEA